MDQEHPHIQGLMEILGQKWVLRILWELSKEPSSFQVLQKQCGDLSPTIITKRLKLLQKQGFVEKSSRIYQLTPLGQELKPAFKLLNDIGQQWLNQKP